MNNRFTGSETQRFSSILNRWLVFEPISSEDYSLVNKLYTVPLGQTVKPELYANTGSFSSSTDTIQIVKQVHVFVRDSEELNDFITEIGTDNIVAIKETTRDIDSTIGTSAASVTVDVTEVHVINNPAGVITMEHIDFEEKNGYVIETYISTSNGLDRVYEDLRLDRNGRLLNDTYLKYFKLVSDE